MNESGLELLDLRRLSFYLMQHSNPLGWIYTGELIPSRDNPKATLKDMPIPGILTIQSSGIYELYRAPACLCGDPTLNGTKIGTIYFEKGFMERTPSRRLAYERADLKLPHELQLKNEDGKPINLPSSLISVRVVDKVIAGLPAMTRVDKTMGWVRSKRSDLSGMLPSSAFLDKSLVCR